MSNNLSIVPYEENAPTTKELFHEDDSVISLSKDFKDNFGNSEFEQKDIPYKMAVAINLLRNRIGLQKDVDEAARDEINEFDDNFISYQGSTEYINNVQVANRIYMDFRKGGFKALLASITIANKN